MHLIVATGEYYIYMFNYCAVVSLTEASKETQNEKNGV